MSESLTNPQNLLKYLGKNRGPDSLVYGKTALVVFQKFLFDFLIQENSLQKLDGHSATREGLNTVLVWSSGMGAPHLIFSLELLRAQGVQNVILFGSCGSFNPDIPQGSVFAIDRALIGEGTSTYYGKELHQIVTFFGELNPKLNFKNQSVLSVDAPFRETETLRNAALQLHVPLVDMETSALFSWGQFYKIPTQSVLCVSDHISNQGWKMFFLADSLKTKMKEVVQSLFFVVDEP